MLSRYLTLYSVLIVAGFILWFLIPTSQSLRAARINQAVLNFPAGTTKSQIASFLHKEKLEASYIGDKQGIDNTSDVANRSYNSHILSGYHVAIIRRTKKAIIGECFVRYFFFYDKKQLLLKATSEEGCIGL